MLINNDNIKERNLYHLKVNQTKVLVLHFKRSAKIKIKTLSIWYFKRQRQNPKKIKPISIWYFKRSAKIQKKQNPSLFGILSVAPKSQMERGLGRGFKLFLTYSI
jgi:hypothetical protein